MASVLFGNTIDMLIVATPSSGYVVAYDLDGILKQKDEFGVITEISQSFNGIQNINLGIGLTGGGTSSTVDIDLIASNGLQLSSGNIELGGIISKSTTIELNGTASGNFNHKLSFIKSGTSQINFQSFPIQSIISIYGEPGAENEPLNKEFGIKKSVSALAIDPNSLTKSPTIYFRKKQSPIPGPLIPSLTGISLPVNNIIGTILWYGNVLGFGATESSAIDSRITNGSGQHGELRFWTKWSDGFNARMVIRNDNVGIGTSTPSEKLQVIGTVSTTGFRMTNGASAGYILQSDGSGNATWQNSSSIGLASKYTSTNSFTASLTQSISHNLNSEDIIVQTYNSSGIQIIPDTLQLIGTASVDIVFSSTQSDVKIVIIG
jgi:hypothetical protein